MKPNILIIEDDPDIAESIRYNLEREGSFTARVALTGEDGLRLALGNGGPNRSTAASEPSPLSGGDFALKNLLKIDAACGESALASTSGKSASKHTAETSKKEDGPQELGRSLDTQAGEGADYGASHSIQQVTFEGAKAPAQARGKTSRAYRRQQRNRSAEEAARDAAGEAPWALLVGEEWEDGQQQEPTGECDDWGLYYQAIHRSQRGSATTGASTTRPWMVATITTPVISVSII